MTSTVSKLLRINKDILDYCLTEEPTELESLSCQQCCVKAAYNIILELTLDSLRMVEKKRHVSSATLLRSLFEYYMELLFLAKNPDNWKQRELDAKREQQKILHSIENSKDPSLAKHKTDSRFKPRKNELNNDLNGHFQKRIWNLCDELGFNWMYDMVYRVLSFVAHPSIVNYNNRYFKVDPSGEMLEYDPAPQLNEEDAIERLVLLSDILVGSTKCIHQILPNCNTSAVEAQLEKFAQEMLKATPRPITEQ